MVLQRLATSLVRALARRLPTRLHTPGMRARVGVERLSEAQRRQLRRNLEAMLRPDAA